MTITETMGENKLQMDIEGKIDSLTSNDFQNAVLRSFQKNKNIVINMDKVDYISSAGLRALILGQKTAASKGGSMVIINVCPAVQDVFRVTGFEKVLTIR